MNAARPAGQPQPLLAWSSSAAASGGGARAPVEPAAVNPTAPKSDGTSTVTAVVLPPSSEYGSFVGTIPGATAMTPTNVNNVPARISVTSLNAAPPAVPPLQPLTTGAPAVLSGLPPRPPLQRKGSNEKRHSSPQILPLTSVDPLRPRTTPTKLSARPRGKGIRQLLLGGVCSHSLFRALCRSCSDDEDNSESDIDNYQTGAKARRVSRPILSPIAGAVSRPNTGVSDSTHSAGGSTPRLGPRRAAPQCHDALISVLPQLLCPCRAVCCQRADFHTVDPSHPATRCDAFCKTLLRSPFMQLGLAVCSLIVLFAGDILLANHEPITLDTVTALCIISAVVLTLEIIVRSCVEDAYFGSLLFCLDMVGTFSLVVPISYLYDGFVVRSAAVPVGCRWLALRLNALSSCVRFGLDEAVIRVLALGRAARAALIGSMFYLHVLFVPVY
jgi:hypothetical protein